MPYKDLFPNDGSERLELEIEKKRFAEWKSKYDIELKKDKKTQFKKSLLFGLITVLVFSLVLILISGKLRFLGHDTEIAKAKINRTAKIHLGYGTYTQRIDYQFEYNGIIYSKTEKTIKLPRLKEGDHLKIKFSTRKPDRVEIIGYYKKERNKPKWGAYGFEVSSADSIIQLTPDSVIRINKTKPNSVP